MAWSRAGFVQSNSLNLGKQPFLNNLKLKENTGTGLKPHIFKLAAFSESKNAQQLNRYYFVLVTTCFFGTFKGAAIYEIHSPTWKVTIAVFNEKKR